MKILLLAIVVFLVLTFVYRLKGSDVLSEGAARKQLASGALVVDVRTVDEFNTRHLTNAVNVPLSDLKDRIAAVVTNKSDVVLLHCRSGRRSAIAEKELRSLGYTNAFNIGSFERAEKIVNGSAP